MIIAWDKETDTAINPERPPVEGEWCRVTNGKRVTKRQYHEPTVSPPDPTHRTDMYADELLALFSVAEYEAAELTGAGRKLLDEIRAAAGRLIDITHPRVTAGVKSVVTKTRATNILKGVPL